MRITQRLFSSIPEEDIRTGGMNSLENHAGAGALSFGALYRMIHSSIAFVVHRFNGAVRLTIGKSREGTHRNSDEAAESVRPGWGSSNAIGTDMLGFPGWKRALDLTCVLLSLPLWLPLMSLVALWIKVVSPGATFFRQERIGYRGRRFMILKFRSMKVDAETSLHENHLTHLIKTDCPMRKLDAAGDPRLILGGRVLRALGIDELPQIVNVIRGEMSLVGPRPCTPHEFQHYEVWQQQRVNAPPGLTGFWQVNGKNKTTFNQMIQMDFFYTRNMSPMLDLKIMLKTIPAILAQAVETRMAHRRRDINPT